jgi:hypothetical protein
VLVTVHAHVCRVMATMMQLHVPRVFVATQVHVNGDALVCADSKAWNARTLRFLDTPDASRPSLNREWTRKFVCFCHNTFA